jgi:hypothetical protein
MHTTDEAAPTLPSTMVMALWCHMTAVDGKGSPAATLVMQGTGAPGLSALDTLARWILEADRAQRQIAIVHLAPEMVDLLELAGLRVEVERKAEGGKESFRVKRVQEEGQFGDLAL